MKYIWILKICILFVIVFCLIIINIANAKGDTKKYNNPFSYCKAVKNIDTPDKSYIGLKKPPLIIEKLKHILNMPKNVSKKWIEDGLVWRCMNGQVWACFKGANIPCTIKGNSSKTPSEKMKFYCKKVKNSNLIPAYITGHNTIYKWSCIKGTPVIIKQIYHLDSNGFIKEFWHEIDN